jgi:carnitine 3-dehydrogenase
VKPVVGLVGTGVIGTGWAVRALARGWSVVAFDPANGAEERLRAGIERAWPSARKLGLFRGADRSRVTWAGSVAEVAATAGFIQESVPEDPGVKQGVHAELDTAANGDVIIASSSSGLLPSKMQTALGRPERFVVGHPFNPVYLLPLVELVPGQATSESTVERASDLYEDLGMHPLLVRNEIEGYLSDRLQEAMWREILHLVNDGVATTEELDRAVIYGPGLRWAGMGTNLTFHLAGGEGGMRHMLEQFGPALELPWTHLEAPELTDELIDRMAEGTETQADGQNIEDLERLRDDYLISVMRALRPHGIGAGPVLEKHEAQILGDQPASWSSGSEIPTPLQLYSCPVEPEWVDYNGHMTESAFLLAAGWATDGLFRYVGIDEDYREAGLSYFTVESHMRFLREASVDDRLRFETTVLGADQKRLHFVHLVVDDDSGDRLASVEQMAIHVDTEARRSSPVLSKPHEALRAIVIAHSASESPIIPTMTLG